MGFKVGVTWYQYTVLPFSLKWSPWAFTKVVRTMVQWWQSQGLLVFSYINNFAVVAATCKELLQI
jgi:hypothetical protein